MSEEKESGSTDSSPENKIYAIRYASNRDRKKAENFLDGDPHDDLMPMDFFVWAIVSENRTVIVDTGFDEASARARGRTVLRPVGDGLREVGIDPASVKDIVITHLHWDHSGNHDLFPNATYHLQTSEMAYSTGPCMCHSHLRRPFNVEDVKAMVHRVFDDRVTFHDKGASELFPGISLHWVGGHSSGLQVVRVFTARGWVVLASDASHYYANFRERRPFPLVVNVSEMLDAYKTLYRLAQSPDHIIPGHDPKVLSLYPAVEGSEGIARLDLKPHG